MQECKRLSLDNVTDVTYVTKHKDIYHEFNYKKSKNPNPDSAKGS